MNPFPVGGVTLLRVAFHTLAKIQQKTFGSKVLKRSGLHLVILFLNVLMGFIKRKAEFSVSNYWKRKLIMLRQNL